MSQSENHFSSQPGAKSSAPKTPPQSAREVIGKMDARVRKDFETNRRVLAFEEYIQLLNEEPESQLRGSAKYLADMMEHFGRVPVDTTAADASQESSAYRFRVFDGFPEDAESTARKVVGQEEVQMQLWKALKTFERQGANNRLLLLHGPNGSAKSSIIHALMTGLEKYSHEKNGAVYSFNWVFPQERAVRGTMGMGSSSANPRDPHASFARLPDEEVMARIPCDLKDHPLLILPPAQRKEFLIGILGSERAEAVWDAMPQYLARGDLCHRCKNISDALLNANGGDFRKVLAHVQVERFYYSKRYRKGVITIEPQMHVDAHYQQLTMNRSMGSLPASLQSLNLFSLSGDLVEANRGVVEYSDLLKRPIDTFKYLLISCETGSVNVGPAIAHMDSVMLGSSNELQLDAFKEFPDFTSFKGRIELIRVPYLLRVSEEEQVYAPDLEQIAKERHVAPHTGWTVALWSVLTRLKKPNSINYPPSVSTIISQLSPIEKARLYDSGEMPGHLTPEERKVLRASVQKLRDEYLSIPYYEGRMGASAREMKSVLHNAAQNPEFHCLSPLSVLRELEDFVKRVSEYEFLKQDVKDGYHDNVEFISTVRKEYLSRIDREVRESIGLYDVKQWEDFLRKYVQHVSFVLKKEKVKNPITGKSEDPDFPLIEEFEKIVEAPSSTSDKEAFRQNVISQVGAWSLDHPGQAVAYAKIFPEYFQKLEKHYFETQKGLITKMHNALKLYGTDDPSIDQEGHQLAVKTLGNMTAKLGYCEHCAREVVTFLMRTKY
jgi:serine protein kinase